MYCQEMYVMGQYQGMGNCQTIDNGGGGGGAYYPPGGGGGGGGNSAGVWINGSDGDVQINLVKNEVRALTLGCGDEEILRSRAATNIVLKNTQMSASTTVTLYVADGKQQFRRISSGGSVQMGPISSCKP